MAKSFYTVGTEAETEIIINRSRFIGRAFPISNEEDALLLLDQVRGDFPDASHHCYAYVRSEAIYKGLMMTESLGVQRCPYYR